MDNKLFFIIYLIIGGIFAGSVDRHAVTKCNTHANFQDSGFMIVAWPGVITAALITKSTGEDICKP